MPQTEASNGPQLAIHLEREQPTFTLPDTVVGHVTRKAEVVTSKAVVTIALVGRSKSRMVVRHGSWGRTYRGRYPLVNAVEQLFESPLHIPANGEERTWPFAITLPSTHEVESTTRKLPPSFATQDWGYGYGMGCFVEYYLRAELTTTSRGSSHVVEAILPLTITTLHEDSRPAREQYRLSTYLHGLHTKTLVPEPSNIGMQSTAETGSTTAPYPAQSSIVIEVRTPPKLHLDRVGPIPFLLLAKLDLKHESNGSLSSEEILVTNILVDLIASTGVKCQGKRSVRHTSTETKWKLCPKEAYEASAAIFIPWAAKDAVASGSNPTVNGTARTLDAGDKLGMKLPSEGLFDSFTTHNIQHSHRLEWKMVVRVNGHDLDCSGSEAVEIVAPSRDSAPVEYEILENEALVERTRSASAEAILPEYGHEDFDQPLPPRDTARSRTRGAYGLSSLWQNVG